MSKFREPAAFQAASADWQLLPFRFERIRGRVLLTNLVGEHLFLSAEEFEQLGSSDLPTDSPLVRRLRAKHVIREKDDELPVELLAIKARTRYRRLAEFTSLHILVASLRCEHSCPYCQVSRQSSDREAFDMRSETAALALDSAFRSPSQNIKIEFQGGEPLLNFGLIEEVVEAAETRNETEHKNLGFVIATNLALLDDRVLDFCRAHNVYISTSLDGPADLHNKNRPRPGRNSWELATAGIQRVREELGVDRVSALMTTTRSSLGRVREIVDAYVEQGLTSIFLRTLSPYGFAIKTKSFNAYDVDHWLPFYEEGLDYIIELNARGVPMVEQYAALILKKMLTNDDPGYVDLTSPAGIGIGAIVYNYDGDVYASDEGRMLAEMGDKTFRLGNLHDDSYEEIMLSEALLAPLEESFAPSAPMCQDCAFETYCGSDPTYHHATSGDFLGRKPTSGFCRRNMAIFKLLLERYEGDATTRALFQTWAGH
ncbi:MAG TPA: His-Xaa-Ser system radical SAM maturase HxsB [Solirubrobacterales bacterium]|nr:His-Xaa-Ser system radical SAM maturase HxsB [Solirubrobacterales bacterium]